VCTWRQGDFYIGRSSSHVPLVVQYLFTWNHRRLSYWSKSHLACTSLSWLLPIEWFSIQYENVFWCHVSTVWPWFIGIFLKASSILAFRTVQNLHSYKLKMPCVNTVRLFRLIKECTCKSRCWYHVNTTKKRVAPLVSHGSSLDAT